MHLEQERIQIMKSLASTAPLVSQSQHGQLPTVPAISQSLPHAHQPPVEGPAGDATDFHWHARHFSGIATMDMYMATAI